MRYLTSLLTAAVMSCISWYTVAAQENGSPVSAQGVFCDEREQSHKFVSMWDGSNSKEAVETVNKDAGKDTACLFLTAMLYEQETYDLLTTPTGVWLQVKVSIIGVRTPTGWLHTLPLTQYTYRKVSDPPKQSNI